MPCAWSPFRSPAQQRALPLPPKPFSPAPPRYWAGHVQHWWRVIMCLLGVLMPRGDIRSRTCLLFGLRGGALACPARGRTFAPRAAASSTHLPPNHSPLHLRYCAGKVQPKHRRQILRRVPVLPGGALACFARGRAWSLFFSPRSSLPYPLSPQPFAPAPSRHFAGHV